MTDEQHPTWAWNAMAAKTWGDIGGVPLRDGDAPGENRNQYIVDIGAKLDSQQAEIETLKARVLELEEAAAVLTPVMISRMRRFFELELHST